MQLLAAGPSPYVRKVRMTAIIKGLMDKIEIVSPGAPDIEALRARNPLGKIPVLLRDGAPAIFDSHVICEYLDSLAPEPQLFPASGDARTSVAIKRVPSTNSAHRSKPSSVSSSSKLMKCIIVSCRG